MLSIHSGHSVEYLTREVAARQRTATGAVAGRTAQALAGAGAEALGLGGLVDHRACRRSTSGSSTRDGARDPSVGRSDAGPRRAQVPNGGRVVRAFVGAGRTPMLNGVNSCG
jgi:hypothetical protein